MSDIIHEGADIRNNQPETEVLKKNPWEVAIFLRDHSFFSDEKGHEDEISVDKFMEYFEVRLMAQLKLYENKAILDEEKRPIMVEVENYTGKKEPKIVKGVLRK